MLEGLRLRKQIDFREISLFFINYFLHFTPLLTRFYSKRIQLCLLLLLFVTVDTKIRRRPSARYRTLCIQRFCQLYFPSKNTVQFIVWEKTFIFALFVVWKVRIETNLVLIRLCRMKTWRPAVSCNSICLLWGFLPVFGGCGCTFLSLASLLAPAPTSLARFFCNFQLLQGWMPYAHLWWQLGNFHSLMFVAHGFCLLRKVTVVNKEPKNRKMNKHCLWFDFSYVHHVQTSLH